MDVILHGDAVTAVSEWASRLTLWPHSLVACAHFTQQVPSHVSPEHLVSQAVDNRADEPRQDLDKDMDGKVYVQFLLGQQEEQTLFKHGPHINKHAQQQLETVEENSVSGFFEVHSCSLGGKQNPEVGVKEREPNQDETNDVRCVPLLHAVGASEHFVSGT